MQTPLTRLMDDYASAHQTRGNQICHSLGVPLILVSLLALLPSAGAAIVIAGAALWYCWQDWRLGLPFTLVLCGALVLGQLLGSHLSSVSLWGLFVLGWVFQGIGHALFEKKSPSFASNLRHLLVGPIWLFAKWV